MIPEFSNADDSSSDAPVDGVRRVELTPRELLAQPGHVGNYRLIRVIGEGGMGIVYEAEQARPRRTVALKMVRPGAASPSQLWRFEREVELLGRLSHPGLARVYEAGQVETPTGKQPFLAMELVRGYPLTEYAERAKLDVESRVQLLATVCDAVHFAHQQGVIHRDLKPSNILVDETGQPKILDFGLAKITDSDVKRTMQTETGHLLGTLAYMSPEQARGDASAIDVRCDVYALGVLGYELLTGMLPYNVSGRAIHEAVRVIIEEDSARLSSVDRKFRGDLEWIFSKAMEKEPSRRYAAVSELASDLRRYLKSEPVLARPPSAMYQLGKFARRNRALIAGAVAVLIVLLLGVAGTTTGLIQARREAAETERQRARAEVEARSAKLSAESARAESAERERINYALNLNLASSQIQSGNLALAAKALADCPQALRGWEWDYLSATIDQSSAVIDINWPAASLDWSPDGNRIAIGAQGAHLGIYDAGTGQRLTLLSGHQSVEAIYHVRFTPDGKRVVSAAGDATIRVWDAATGAELDRFMTARRLIQVFDMSDDGKRVIYQSNPVGPNTPLQVIDLDSRQTRDISASPPRVIALAWRPKHDQAATIDADGRLAMIDLVADRRLWTEQAGRSRAASTVTAFSVDGKTMISQSLGKSLMIRPADGSPGGLRIGGFDDMMLSGAFSPNGQMVAVAGVDRAVYVISVGTGEIVGKFHGHRAFVWQLKWAPDGERLATASIDGTVRIWRVNELLRPQTSLESPSEFESVASDASGNRILAATRSHGLQLIDPSGKSPARTIGFSLRPNQVGLSRDGTIAAAIAVNGTLATWRIGDAIEPLVQMPGVSLDDSADATAARACLAIHPDGRSVFTPMPNAITARDSRDGKSIRVFPLDSVQRVRSLALTTNGELLVVVQSKNISVFDVGTGARRWTLNYPGDPSVGTLTSLAISPDDKQLAVGDRRAKIRIFDISSGQLMREFAEADGEGGGFTMSPDTMAWGSRLFVSSSDNLIKVWDVDHSQLLLTLTGHKNRIYGMTVLSDDRRVVSASWDKKILIWSPFARQMRVQFPRTPAPAPWNSLLDMPTTSPSTAPGR